MPGSPPTSPRFGIPRYSDADTAQFSSQVNAITDGFDADAAKLVPVVSSLPSSPDDGDECFVVADATNGVIWRFRYRAASSSTFKWEFVGGSSLRASSQATHTFMASQGFTALSPSVQIVLPTLPNGGDFEVTIGGTWSAEEGVGILSYSTNGPPQVADGLYIASSASGSQISSSGQATALKTALPGGTTVTAEVLTNQVGGGTNLSLGVSAFGGTTYLEAKPVRVG